ncbi:MAG: outer membrane beta-barrel protein [Bacteroidota bacterium]
MKRTIPALLVFLLVIPALLQGQDRSLSGTVLNRKGEALPYATAVLLDPADSTLVYYGITGDDGGFEIRNVKDGRYLLQVAFVGYKPLYRDLSMPGAAGSRLILVPEELKVDLGEVEIVGEAVPLMIKGDTVEYKRAAYRLQEGAMVEDLLRKLPGIEVDRAGNVKAMGEDVNQVYVDGKEFFGSDPKMATKNLPADAVDKVQMFDKKSEEAEFTGIDDGSRQKALNIVLEEDMKNLLFGSLSGGGGVPSVYEGAARVFYRTDRINTALIGMVNNTSNPGFSFGDYMNFNGTSIGGVHSGSMSMRISLDNSLPVNFGQPVYGLNTAGAGGVNFSYASDKFNRTSLSYLFSGTGRKLTEESYSRNYTAGTGFEQNSTNEETRSDTMHIFNFGMERRIDSLTRFSLSLRANLNRGNNRGNSSSSSEAEAIPVSLLEAVSLNQSAQNGFSGEGSFTRMLARGRTVLKLSGRTSWTDLRSYDGITNRSLFYEPLTDVLDRLYRDDRTGDLQYSSRLTLVQKTGKRSFLEPSFRISGSTQELARSQGLFEGGEVKIDSLSPQAWKKSASLVPGLGYRLNGDKSKFHIQLEYQAGKYYTGINEDRSDEHRIRSLLPAADFEYDFSTGRRLSLYYASSVNEPAPGQLYPVSNSLNPLYILRGNPDLEPEKSHQAFANLLIFDQFSMTSFFLSLSADYTRNKINWSRSVSDLLVQTLVPVNVDYGYNLRANFNFSRPLRKLGVKMNLSLQELYQGSLAPVNGTDNKYSSLGHDLSLSFENRKKQKWDLVSGIGFRLTDTWFSVREDLGDRYFDLNWFSDLSWTPNKTWDFTFSADVLNYNRQSFNEAVFVPLLNAEANFHFLQNKRATLSLSAHDLLNRETGVERYSDQNFLQETRRSMLGRFVLLKFTYRLNKNNAGGEGFDLRIR